MSNRIYQDPLEKLLGQQRAHQVNENQKHSLRVVIGFAMASKKEMEEIKFDLMIVIYVQDRYPKECRQSCLENYYFAHNIYIYYVQYIHMCYVNILKYHQVVGVLY